MDLLPTAEQEELARALARLLGSQSAAGRPLATESDDTLATRLAEMGWLAIGVPQEAGGAGLSLAEQALAVREFGRALAPPHVLAAALAARCAMLAGFAELSASASTAACRTAIMVPCGDEAASSSFSGGAYLIDGGTTGLALLVAPAGVALFEIGDFADKVSHRSFDEGFTLSRTAASDASALCRVAGPQPYQEALVLNAAYCAGICEAVCAMATDYAKTREQFGQAIGAFQAVKHRCADMAIRADAAWSQVLVAALAVDGRQADAEFQATCAAVVAASYAIAGAQENIQLHGAIGTTAELAAHRYLKRAHVMALCFGSLDLLKQRLLACGDPQDLPA